MFVLLIIFIVAAAGVTGLDNGLARTPPMGWMSWAKYFCQTDCIKYPTSCISEQLYMQMADKLVSEGYRDVGYKSVHIDDCWMSKQRDAQGHLFANTTRFPNGIKKLTDYMHTRGLLLGIYEDYGTTTCAGYPGSLGHLQTDANTFAQWGVDYLKLDGCNVNISMMNIGYPQMSQFLNESGRPIVYSCSWPDYQRASHMKPNYTFVAKYCNLWRNFDDIAVRWSSIESIIRYYIQEQDTLGAVNGPGQWNDPDMIVVGNSELTVDQSRAQMAIWSMWSAPLIMSNDLRAVDPAYKQILQNKKVIAIDQDPMGIMAKVIINGTDWFIFTKPVTPVDRTTNPTSWAVAFLNVNPTSKLNITVTLQRLGLTNTMGYFVEELFTGHKYGLMKPADTFGCTVNPTGVVMVKATLAQTRVNGNLMKLKLKDFMEYIS